MANIFTQKPYQTNQSSFQQTDPKKAAASSVPPANAFMQGLNGAWQGLKNFGKSLLQPGEGASTKITAQNPGYFVKPIQDVAKTKKDKIPPASTYGNLPESDANLQAFQETQNKQVNKDTGNTYQAADASQQNSNIPTYTPIDNQETGGTNNQNSYINNLANTENPTTYQQVVNNLANFKNPLYEQSIKNVQSLRDQETQGVMDLGGRPMTAGSMQGQAGTLMTGYQNKIGNELALANAALTGGQQQLSGLQSAQGAMQPQLGGYGQTYYNPLSAFGGNQGGAGVSTSDPFYATMQTYANLLANNQGASIPSSITGNSVLNAQLLQMAKQINPNFNPNVASGIGSAQSSTAATQTAQVQQWTSALQQGQNLQSQLNDLITTFGLNPADLNAANAGIQKIASNVSSPQYKMLSNYIAEVANTYAQILTPAGSNVSDYKTQIANSMLDQTAKGTSLAQVMQGLDNQAQAKIAGVPTYNSFNQNSTSNSYQPGQTNSTGELKWDGTKWIKNQ